MKILPKQKKYTDRKTKKRTPLCMYDKNSSIPTTILPEKNAFEWIQSKKDILFKQKKTEMVLMYKNIKYISIYGLLFYF